MSNEGSEGKGEQLSFSQKKELVEDVFRAALNRENYIKSNWGSFDNFADTTDEGSEARAEENRLLEIVGRLRENVAQTITDKEEFAAQLEDGGQTELADKFRRMFKVQKPSSGLSGLIGRWRKGE